MSLKAAILGFLQLEPTSGYLLRKRFEGSVGSFWSVTQSQIYRELHALERDGSVTSEREEGEGRPASRAYRLSEKGRAELEGWLRAPVEPLQLRHPLLLKFVFAADLDPSALDGVLADYGAHLAATRDEYRARLKMREIFDLARSKREATIWRLSIEHGLAWFEAELRWVNKARRALRAGRAER